MQILNINHIMLSQLKVLFFTLNKFIKHIMVILCYIRKIYSRIWLISYFLKHWLQKTLLLETVLADYNRKKADTPTGRKLFGILMLVQNQ